MAGLLQQDYGNTQLPDIMQQIMSPTTVVERAFDWIERQKQQEMRRKWNEGELEQQQVLNPLERMVKTLEAKRAEAMSSPEMLQSYTQGYRGQNDLQDVQGRIAKVLEPFTQRSKQVALENETGQNQLEGEYYKHLNASQDQSLPERVRISAMERANTLREELKNTPKFAGQKELTDDKLQNALAIAELNRQAKQKEQVSSAEKAWVNYQKSPPETRIALSQSAVSTGRNPFTQEALSEQEKAHWKQLYEQDRKTINAKNQARVAGQANVGAMTGGKVPTYGIPDVGSKQTGVGETSSGVKFKVVPSN